MIFSPARADTFAVTFINVTFSAPCYQASQSTCTEVVNGTADYDNVADEATNIALSLSGTLTGSLDGWYNGTGTNPCYNGSVYCLDPDLFFDLNAANTYDPIEFSPTINNLDVPTPTPLIGGADGTLLFVPGFCGDDQANCKTTGDFSVGDFQLTSGSYTSVDQAPEPGSIILFASGLAAVGILTARRFRTRTNSR